MTDINKLEGHLSRLRADRTARETRLAAIEPEQDALRAQLRRARGEAELGSAPAKKTAADLERRLAALAGERDAVGAALEILDEWITAAEADLAAERTAQNEAVVIACRKLEAAAYESYTAAMRAIVEPIAQMQAAARIAARHGGEITSRGETIRSRIVGAAAVEVTWAGIRRNIRNENPGAPGIPDELRSASFVHSLGAAMEAATEDLRSAGLVVRPVPAPAAEQPEGNRPAFPTPALEVEEPSPATEVIVMGRTRPDEIIAGVAVAQSARPPAGFRGSSPKPAATSEPIEQIAAFPGRRA